MAWVAMMEIDACRLGAYGGGHTIDSNEDACRWPRLTEGTCATCSTIAVDGRGWYGGLVGGWAGVRGHDMHYPSWRALKKKKEKTANDAPESRPIDFDSQQPHHCSTLLRSSSAFQ